MQLWVEVMLLYMHTSNIILSTNFRSFWTITNLTFGHTRKLVDQNRRYNVVYWLKLIIWSYIFTILVTIFNWNNDVTIIINYFTMPMVPVFLPTRRNLNPFKRHTAHKANGRPTFCPTCFHPIHFVQS